VTGGQGKRFALLGLCIGGMLLFGGLGVWQVQRLAWKRDLIARVEARIHLPAVPVPAAGVWPSLDLREAEYRRVEAHGVFLHERETLVDALTALGPGSWVLTPLRTSDGDILINRGFVPPDLRAVDARASSQTPGRVLVTGLLRLSEPGGRILRPNQPGAGRWFSRDVAAIAAAQGLGEVAPFFVDAEGGAEVAAAPVGGLTVVGFRNAHLAYAATWFSLAALCATGLALVWRRNARDS
jgi:surfeit locus 1 family protein